MEPTSKTTPRPKKIEQEDIDLGQLFHKTGGVINSILSGLGRFFSHIFNAILNFVFFLKRHIIILIIGAALGAGYGLYISATYGERYASDLTVKANFNSSRALYGSIDYFNSLISNAKTDELGKILKITPAEARSLVYMEAKPVKSEIITAELYRSLFFKNERNVKARMDTFWIRTVSYEDFKSSLTKYDYPLHEISVVSTDAEIFPKIQQGIIDKISSNELFQQVMAMGKATNSQVVDIINSSIESLDSLRNTYNRRLATVPAGSESRNGNINLFDGNTTARVPELDLYDKLLELKDELKSAKAEDLSENDIIQVYSSFSSVGLKESIFKQSVMKYSYLSLLITFIILSAISFYKYLSKIEKSRNKRKARDISDEPV